jgi:hypothetical protein
LTKGWKEAEGENPPVQALDGLIIKGMSEENLLYAILETEPCMKQLNYKGYHNFKAQFNVAPNCLSPFSS